MAKKKQSAPENNKVDKALLVRILIQYLQQHRLKAAQATRFAKGLIESLPALIKLSLEEESPMPPPPREIGIMLIEVLPGASIQSAIRGALSETGVLGSAIPQQSADFDKQAYSLLRNVRAKEPPLNVTERNGSTKPTASTPKRAKTTRPRKKNK